MDSFWDHCAHDLHPCGGPQAEDRPVPIAPRPSLPSFGSDSMYAVHKVTVSFGEGFPFPLGFRNSDPPGPSFCGLNLLRAGGGDCEPFLPFPRGSVFFCCMFYVLPLEVVMRVNLCVCVMRCGVKEGLGLTPPNQAPPPKSFPMPHIHLRQC